MLSTYNYIKYGLCVPGITAGAIDRKLNKIKSLFLCDFLLYGKHYIFWCIKFWKQWELGWGKNIDLMYAKWYHKIAIYLLCVSCSVMFDSLQPHGL